MPNKDLVEKGRTMSIDQAVQRGMKIDWNIE